MMTKTMYLGIMVCKLPNRDELQKKTLFRRMSKEAEKGGIRAYIFSPESVNWSSAQVMGWAYSSKMKTWFQHLFPLPQYVMDRCFFQQRKDFETYRQFRNQMKKHRNMRLLNERLGGKWQVWSLLRQHPLLKLHLPETERIQKPEQVISKLKKHREVFLKPNGGMQGKGTLHILQVSDSEYIAAGRTSSNQLFHNKFDSSEHLNEWLYHFIGKKQYLLQPYLDFRLPDGSVFDIRVLLQRNEKGRWMVTGEAMRVGAAGSHTSNLNGGGKALSPLPFLQNSLGKKLTNKIITHIRQLSLHIPALVEGRYGKMFELGIDFGIDPKGNIWIIEVNSKPGRSVFRRAGMKKAAVQSARNPIRYVRYLLEQPIGG